MKKLKIFLILPLIVIIFLGFAKPTKAFYFQARKFFKSMNQFVDELTDEEGQHSSRLYETALSSVASSTLVQLCDEPGCVDDETHARLREAGLPPSLVTTIDNQVVAMFNSQPNIDVMAHLADEWVPGHKESKTVYASGFNDLQTSGIQPLWNFMRNIAYLGFVVIMIVIGFMIMFRHKIGGQMMVTVGNTLPRVVISLVLVTFSFAIMGLILDISGVLMRLAVSVLGDQTIHNPFALLMGTLGIKAQLGTVGLLGVGGIVAAIAGPLAPIGWVVIGVVIVILGIIIVGAVKLWFSLVKAYFSLLVNVITAPIVLMFGALPGNNAAISNLFKSALRNALVFPVTYAIVMLPQFFQYLNRDAQVINLAFPETVFEGKGWIEGWDVAGFMLHILKVVAIYVAAQTPQFLKAIIPATASKSGADVGGAIQAGLSKIPLIGGMFGK
ncbi:MAG: hypothetical protein WCY00_01105 [Candidatus Dojkabacteria bacterium]